MVHKKLDRDQPSIYCWWFSLVTVLTLAGVVSWLSLIPKNPCFRISEAVFPGMKAGNSSAHHSVSVPNDTLFIELEVSNPNKRMGVYYSGITLELYRGGGGGGGSNSTPAFYQGYKNATTLLHILIHASHEFWQATNGGNINFTIRVQTAVRFRIFQWKTRLHHVTYEEQLGNVKSRLNGTVEGGGDYAQLQNASKVKFRN